MPSPVKNELISLVVCEVEPAKVFAACFSWAKDSPRPPPIIKPEMATITVAAAITARGRAKPSNRPASQPRRGIWRSASKPTSAWARTAMRAGAAGSDMPRISARSMAARRISGLEDTAASMRAASVSDRCPSSQAAKSMSDTASDTTSDATGPVAKLCHSSLSVLRLRSVVMINLLGLPYAAITGNIPGLRRLFLKMLTKPQKCLVMGTSDGLGIDFQQLCNLRNIPFLIIKVFEDQGLPFGQQSLGNLELFDVPVLDRQRRLGYVVDRRRAMASAAGMVHRRGPGDDREPRREAGAHRVVGFQQAIIIGAEPHIDVL